MTRLGVLCVALCTLGACAGTRPPSQPPPKEAGLDSGLVWPDSGWLPSYDLKTEQPPPSCSSTCSGCCLASGVCNQGTSHGECGSKGALCTNCTAQGTTCVAGSCSGCTPSCAGKLCGASNGCGGNCQTGSGCCSPSCGGKLCGASDGCGGTCQTGSGCCTPACGGKSCGASDGCGGTCQAGSGCCSPACGGKLCGAGDGCGGSCQAGSGCCSPSCGGKSCGASDGCGGTCEGPCPWSYECVNKACVCGPGPHFQNVGGQCKPSCGQYLGHFGLQDNGSGCCNSGCAGAGSNAGATWDCGYCCESPPGCL